MYRIKVRIDQAEVSQWKCCYQRSEYVFPVRKIVRRHIKKNWRLSDFHVNETLRSLKWSSRSKRSRYIVLPRKRKKIKRMFFSRKKHWNKKHGMRSYTVPAGPLLVFVISYLKYPIRINDIYGGFFDLTFYRLADMLIFKVGFKP